MLRKINRPTEALYIHIPFCHKLCDYCDFPKLQYFRIFAKDYMKSLKRELESYKIGETIKTIYIGGGTPTALEDDLFLKLLKMVQPYSNKVIEYTVECNPESLSEAKLKMMKEYGVNRLSIGVESTDDEILKLIGRQHTFKDVQIAIENARKNGFDNINVDLIIGLPHVQKEQFKKDLSNLMDLGVEHISCYSLTVHPNTKFYIQGISEPTDEYARELYDLAESLLKEKGFVHYEVSNWAKPGRESLHNLTYWKDEHYFGVGMGAAGYVGDERYVNTKNIQKYNKSEYIDEVERVTREDDHLYFVMLNLRTTRGIVFEDYKIRFHEDFYETHKNIVDKLIEEKLLIMDEKHIYPTYEGMMILDQIIMEIEG